MVEKNSDHKTTRTFLYKIREKKSNDIKMQFKKHKVYRR
jgi:hypothetical protein